MVLKKFGVLWFILEETILLFTFMYDTQNIFAKILRGEIPCEKVEESPHSLAFFDIHPAAKIHILVIPKGPYMNFHDFATSATPEEVLDFHTIISRIVYQHGLDRAGYKLRVNTGKNGGQEIDHYHVHILSENSSEF